MLSSFLKAEEKSSIDILRSLARLREDRGGLIETAIQFVRLLVKRRALIFYLFFKKVHLRVPCYDHVQPGHQRRARAACLHGRTRL
jgi:hypothetical protein